MLWMIRFLDGPAQKASLHLERAPIFLRVTFGSSNPAMAPQWDALDQLDDVPAPAETIHVYRRASNDGVLHVDAQEKVDGRWRRVGRWYRLAEYRLHGSQPDDSTLRTRELWQQWCVAEQQREKEATRGPKEAK